jgi:hypothetical protein
MLPLTGLASQPIVRVVNIDIAAGDDSAGGLHRKDLKNNKEQMSILHTTIRRAMYLLLKSEGGAEPAATGLEEKR